MKSEARPYRESECSSVSLNLTGCHLDPDKVTEALAMEPDECGKRGQPLYPNGQVKCKQGFWALTVGPSSRERVETQMKKMLRRIAPISDRLKTLVDQEGTVGEAYLRISLTPPAGMVVLQYCFKAEVINEFTALGIDIAVSINLF